MRAILAGVAFAALFTACSNGSSSSTTTSPTAAAVSTAAPKANASAAGANNGEIIKIGVDLPVSGADASTGIPTQNGAVLAIEEAHLPHGFTLAADLLDDAVQGVHDPAAGAQNVKNFISDGSVLAMVGPFNSNVAKSEIPLTNDAGLVQISPANTNDTLTVGKDAQQLRTSHPDTNTYFRDCTRDSVQGSALAKFAKKLGWKHVFIVDDNETYGKGLADVFDQTFQTGGGTVAGHEHITKNQQDFKALLTKAKSQRPDGVFYGGTTSTGGGLVRRQMADVGLSNVPFMGGDGISDSEFVKTAGPMANNSYYSVAAPDANKLPSAKSFVARYKARFKSEIGPYSANGYAAAQVEIAAIAKAIDAAGGKMPARADVLRNVAATKNLATPIGSLGFDANGDPTAPILTISKIVGGHAQSLFVGSK